MMAEGLAEAAQRAGTPLVAAIYNRASKDRTRTRRSVGQQDEENRDACSQNDWQVGRSYVDNYRSASRHATKQREEWPQLVADLEARRYHVLVLWEVSRGDRNDLTWIKLLHLCRDLGVWIHITSHERIYDPRKRRDYKTLADEGLDAADESERTRDRILRDVRKNAASGRPHGRLRFGYRREYAIVDGQRRMVRELIDDDQAAIIREAARRVLEGETAYSIVEDFAARGIVTSKGRRWEVSWLRQLLMNPAYIGKRVYRGEVIGDGDWPPILDEVTYYEVLAKFTDPSRKGQRDNTIKHLLSGIMLCGACGAVCVVDAYRTGVRRYLCRGKGGRRKVGGKRFCVGRVQSKVDDYVTELIVGRLSRIDATELYESGQESANELAELLAAAEEKRARLNAFYDQAADGTVSPAALARIEAKILPEIERLEARARRVRFIPVVGDLLDPDPAKVAEGWDACTVVQQREVIRALIERVELLPVGQGRRGAPAWEGVKVTWAQLGAQHEP